MRIPRLPGRAHQFRIVLCGHKAVEAAAVCLVLMVQGHLVDVTAAHLLIASKTGLLAVFGPVGLTFTRYARLMVTRWSAATILGVCTCAADAAIHSSHYSGEYTEAALTGAGAFAFSLAIAYTPFGKRIDAIAEAILENKSTPRGTLIPQKEADVQRV